MNFRPLILRFFCYIIYVMLSLFVCVLMFWVVLWLKVCGYGSSRIQTMFPDPDPKIKNPEKDQYPEFFVLFKIISNKKKHIEKLT